MAAQVSKRTAAHAITPAAVIRLLALVAQWIERLTSDQMVVGSTPAEGIQESPEKSGFLFLRLFVWALLLLNYCHSEIFVNPFFQILLPDPNVLPELDVPDPARWAEQAVIQESQGLFQIGR